MSQETQSLTLRAETLVEAWKDSIFDSGHGRLKDEGERLLDDIGRSINGGDQNGCEALVVLLSLPDRSATVGLVERVVDQLANAGPAAAAAALPRVLRARADYEEPEFDRATNVLDRMSTPDLVRGLIQVLASGAEAALRDEAFNELTRRGDAAKEELEALSDDPELGALAARCRDKVDCCLPQHEPDADPAPVIGQLAYAYLEAEAPEDADYALESLAAFLEASGGRLDEAASRELKELVGGLVETWLNADADEEQAAFDILLCLVERCGCWFDAPSLDLLREVPVTPQTQPLTSLVEEYADGECGESTPPADGSRQPLLERLRRERVDFTLAPGWETVEGIDRDWESGKYLEILANDVVDELKGEIVESLVGQPAIVSELRLLESHPKAGVWVREVLRRDEELAAAGGRTLDAWAAWGPVPDIDDRIEPDGVDGEAAVADEETSVVADAIGPAASGLDDALPSTDKMKRDFEAFTKRMEEERA